MVGNLLKYKYLVSLIKSILTREVAHRTNRPPFEGLPFDVDQMLSTPWQLGSSVCPVLPGLDQPGWGSWRPCSAIGPPTAVRMAAGECVLPGSLRLQMERGVIFGSPLLLALEALGYILPSSQHGVELAASRRGRGSADCDPDRERPPGQRTHCLPQFLFLTLNAPDLCDTHNGSLHRGRTVEYSAYRNPQSCEYFITY